MGQWSDKTYESDYIMDTIDDFRERKLTLEEIDTILEGADNSELYLGIVSFLIDRSNSEILSMEVLSIALGYAGSLLRDFDYASRWSENWNDRVEALCEEMKAIYNLFDSITPFDFSRYEKVSQEELMKE